MALTFDPKTKLFQADYQAPFGGIDSTAYASSINPANFTSMDSIYIEDNVIKPITTQTISYSGSAPLLNGVYMGYIPVAVANFIGGSDRLVGYLITTTDVYQVTASVSSFNLTVNHLGSYAPHSGGGAIQFPFSFIVIDEIATDTSIVYWTGLNFDEIWSFIPGTGIVRTTNYVGGGILGLLNNQLLNLGGFSALDGAVPNRISWSAPGEYGQFQPYDIPTATGNFAAGFNDLPSTSDIITGFAAIGTVGYLFRTQGITQLNVTGNSLPPFQFNHLWASQLGIGAPYPYSISQYGSLVAFVSDSGVYTLGLGGLSEIGQQARTYIYKLLNRTQNFNLPSGIDIDNGLQGIVVPYLIDTPELFYILGMAEAGDSFSTFPQYQFLAIQISNGNVYNLGKQYQTTNLTRPLQLSWFNPWLITAVTNPQPNRKLTPLILIPTAVAAQTRVDFDLLAFTATAVGTISFRKEQLKLAYIPTVTKVIILGALLDKTSGGFISISVDGGLTFNTSFPDISLSPGVGDAGNGIIQNLISDGVQSLERPQLVLKLQNTQVVEAWYQGTLADYEVI